MSDPGRHAVYRPPAEADSVIVRVMDGCPWNGCTFCGMYKGVAHRTFSRAVMEREVCREAAMAPGARRVFLADGDVMALPGDALSWLLATVRTHMPRSRRVSLYANGCSILEHGEERLHSFRAQGLHTLYLGLESGDEAVLRQVCKRETAVEMVEAVRRAQSCGLRVSVMVLAGLGGRGGSARHASETARVLNAMQPRLLSVLRVIPVPGTPLLRAVEAGRFVPLSERESVAEVRALVAGLELRHTVFRADHSSNVLPLAGRFPRDRQRLLSELDALLGAGILDTTGPGPLPWML